MVRASASSSTALTNFFKSESFGDKDMKLAAAEGAFAYHTVQHNQSFRSMDCTSKLIQCTFEPKFTCGRSKAEAIVLNVLTPFAISELESDLQKANFISIMTDASNHKDVKIFPLLVRYFNPTEGIQVKMLDLKSLPGETSETTATFLSECLENTNLKEKTIALCADNTNCNFGGVSRKGVNNVFTKLKGNLGYNLLGFGCSAHIIHNTIQMAADVLPIDIEGIVSKIYSYFYVYTVRVESLKEFCEFVDQEYKQVLGYSKTRWLALLPAVERLLTMFVPLKSYFESQNECPFLIKSFFENPLSEAWLYFLHNQASTFHSAVQRVEGQTITVFEVISVLNDLKANLVSKGEDCFITSAVRSILGKLEKEGLSSEIAKFKQYVHIFYQTAAEYLNKWIVPIESLRDYSWVTLKAGIPQWKGIQKTEDFIREVAPSSIIDGTGLYDEYVYIKQYITPNILKKWKLERTPPSYCYNFFLILEFLLCLPGINKCFLT